jgi:hypothetical protein
MLAVCSVGHAALMSATAAATCHLGLRRISVDNALLALSLGWLPTNLRPPSPAGRCAMARLLLAAAPSPRPGLCGCLPSSGSSEQIFGEKQQIPLGKQSD